MNNQKIKRPAGFHFWFKANCWYFPLLGLVIYSVLPNSFHITWSALFLRCTRFSPTSLARVRVIMTIVRTIIGQLGPTPGEICCQTLDTALNINTWLWLRYSLGIMKPKQIVKSIISPLNFHWSTYTKTITKLSTTGNKKQKQKHLQIIEPEVLNTSNCSDLFNSNTVHSVMVATSEKSTLLDGNSNNNSL